MILSDSYSLFLQLKIIANIQEYINFAILDVISFFYQWVFYLYYHFMVTIITHHSQKFFHISIIEYINLVTYV